MYIPKLIEFERTKNLVNKLRGITYIKKQAVLPSINSSKFQCSKSLKYQTPKNNKNEKIWIKRLGNKKKYFKSRFTLSKKNNYK